MMDQHLSQDSDFPAQLAQPARRALVEAGYLRLEQLAGVREAELKRLHGIGPNALAQLRQALETKGLSFAGDTNVSSGRYAAVNGLKMYYEIHGSGKTGTETPLVLLHGALSATGTSFGQVLPALSKSRQVIAIEQQAHGRTSDIDRPLSIEQMADDTVTLLRQIGVQKADFFGYSMGAAIALDITVRYPQMVRKQVLAAISYNEDGFHPGLLEGIDQLQPEHLYGSPFHDEYVRTAPDPDSFPTLVERVKELDRNVRSWPADAIRAIQAPTLLIFGDSDIVRPEHAVEMFRLLGGGVIGDNVGLPRSRLAILPGTTHITLANRADWLGSMINEFLDFDIPETAA